MKTLQISIIAILTVLVLLPLNVTLAQNATNSSNQIPSGAIRTPDGGWITPLQTHDENGKNLTIHYETGIPVYGKVPPPVPNFITQIMLSPLKQFKSGVSMMNITCGEGLVLMIKKENGSPACVTPQTSVKLIERGWGSDADIPISLHSIQNVSVTSIKMIPPYTPGGPVIQLTLKNISTKSITSLNAILETNWNYTFNFKDVTSSTPLISDNSASDTTMLIGGGFQTELEYPLIISGIEDNIPFKYTEKVHIQG